jgi:hypothetical protein
MFLCVFFQFQPFAITIIQLKTQRLNQLLCRHQLGCHLTQGPLHQLYRSLYAIYAAKTIVYCYLKNIKSAFEIGPYALKMRK